MTAMGESISIVELLGVSEGGSCGYCKGRPKEGAEKSAVGEDEEEKREGNSHCLGAWGHRLNVGDYQRLLNRGWRRSGCYLYKPRMNVTCCPQYTIRLDIREFLLSRTQKRAMRNMQLFLQKDHKGKEVKEETKEIAKKGPKEENEKKDACMNGDASNRSERGEKKKEKRRKRAIERWKKSGIDVDEKQLKRKEKEEGRRKSLEERIGNDSGEGWAHKLELSLVPVGSDAYAERADESYELFKKYQESIHKDDDVSLRGYERFLVKSPLTSFDPALGSFHLRYILDGKMIAVGVVDILPQSLSAKYLFYHPDYSFLSLGTYTALREIALVRTLNRKYPQLKYYYMGYYIPDCPKMRYKGRFRPSELLCDRTFEWVELSEAEKLIDENGGAFTEFRPRLPRAHRMDPAKARLYQRGGVTSLRRLSPGRKESVMPRLQEMCEAIGGGNEGIVMVMKEMETIGTDDMESGEEEEEEEREGEE